MKPFSNAEIARRKAHNLRAAKIDVMQMHGQARIDAHNRGEMMRLSQAIADNATRVIHLKLGD